MNEQLKGLGEVLRASDSFVFRCEFLRENFEHAVTHSQKVLLSVLGDFNHNDWGFYGYDDSTNSLIFEREVPTLEFKAYTDNLIEEYPGLKGFEPDLYNHDIYMNLKIVMG